MFLSSKTLLFVSVIVILAGVFLFYLSRKYNQWWLIPFAYIIPFIVKFIFVVKPITSPSGAIVFIFLLFLVAVTHLFTHLIYKLKG